jgi:hypothetical protein
MCRTPRLWFRLGPTAQWCQAEDGMVRHATLQPAHQSRLDNVTGVGTPNAQAFADSFRPKTK